MGAFVSILVPCHNAERWVEQAIESALAQTWPEKEVIVVDDGSKDQSLSVIKKFDGRIRWETGPNRGSNAARNRLLSLARGEWLQYLDADDYLLPDKVAQQMRVVERSDGADVVFSRAIKEYCDGGDGRREVMEMPEPHDPWVLLASWHLSQTGAALWRKQAIINVGGWKEDQPCCQEHELYLRLLKGGKRFVPCAEVGAVYRQWGEHTLCKRDKAETHRRRLEIEGLIEEFLSQRGELTSARLQAINQNRFETARLVWQYDRQFGNKIAEAIRRSQARFVPSGKAAPFFYRVAYRLLGLDVSERIARIKRMVSSGKVPA